MTTAAATRCRTRVVQGMFYGFTFRPLSVTPLFDHVTTPVRQPRAPCAYPWRDLGGLSRLLNFLKGVGHVEDEVVGGADEAEAES